MRRFCSIAIIVFVLPALAQTIPTDTPATDSPMLFKKSRTHKPIGASYLDPPCLANELSAWGGLNNPSILRFDRTFHFSMDPINDDEKELKVWDDRWPNLQPKKEMKWPLELDPQQHPIPETTPPKPKPVITPCTNPQGHAIPECNPQPQPKPKPNPCFTPDGHPIPECNPQPQPKPKPKSNPCIDVQGHAIPECNPEPKPKPKRDIDPIGRATSGLEVDLDLGQPSPPVRICH